MELTCRCPCSSWLSSAEAEAGAEAEAEAGLLPAVLAASWVSATASMLALSDMLGQTGARDCWAQCRQVVWRGALSRADGCRPDTTEQRVVIIITVACMPKRAYSRAILLFFSLSLSVGVTICRASSNSSANFDHGFDTNNSTADQTEKHRGANFMVASVAGLD